LASQVAGARSWLNAADRLYQLPVGLVGVAIGVALLPRLSRAVHTSDERDAAAAMDEAITFAMAFTLPAAAAMLAMPFFMIDGLFTRGAFHLYDSRQTGAVLLQYGWGAPAFVLMQIINRAFYARQDTRTPMRVAMIQVAANVVLGLGLFRLVGAPGIAAATSASSWLSVAQMAVILRRRGHYSPAPRAWSRLARCLLASGLLGLALFAAQHWRPELQRLLRPIAFGPIQPKELALALTAALALPLYAALLFAFGGVTPAELKGALRRR
jgi:putative peptidoglycan lipid II flippase